VPAYDPAFEFAGPRMVDLLEQYPSARFSEADPDGRLPQGK